MSMLSGICHFRQEMDLRKTRHKILSKHRNKQVRRKQPSNGNRQGNQTMRKNTAKRESVAKDGMGNRWEHSWR